MPDWNHILGWYTHNLTVIGICWLLCGWLQVRRASENDPDESAGFWSGYVLMAIGVLDLALPRLLPKLATQAGVHEIDLGLFWANAVLAVVVIVGLLAILWDWVKPRQRARRNYAESTFTDPITPIHQKAPWEQ